MSRNARRLVALTVGAVLPAALLVPLITSSPAAAAPPSGAVRLTPQQITHLTKTVAVVPKTTAQQPAASGTDQPGVLSKQGGVETPRGSALVEPMAGTSGDIARIHVNGTVARMSTDGTTTWQRDTASLFAEWQPTWQLPYQKFALVPTMFYGRDPFDPHSAAGQAYSVGDLTGDGVADVAVAYNVGYDHTQPFTVSYSQLHTGTFVDVLDGRTGKTVWFHLFPGIVTQLRADAGTLLVGDDTGPDWRNNPVAEQGDSRSSLIAYRFHGHSAQQIWTYNTQVPWATWLDVTSTGTGSVAASWSDTPLGLGTPRPPAAHVVLLDARTGALRWDVKSPDYPRVLRYDSALGALVTGEENDPTDQVRSDVVTYDLRHGHRDVVATLSNQFVSDLAVTSSGVAVSSVTTDADGYLTASSVTSYNPGTGQASWSRTFPAPAPQTNGPVVYSLLPVDGRVVATVGDELHISREHPDGNDRTQLVGFDARTGAIAWRHENAAVGSPIQAAADGDDVLTMATDDTAYLYRARTGAVRDVVPVLGDVYAAVAYDVNGDGVKDLIVGGQSRGVFALDGKQVLAGREKVLWQTTVPGPVRELTLANTDGRPELVVAATLGAVVIRPTTGRVVETLDTGGRYVWTIATGDLNGDGKADLAIPTDRLTAYRGTDGAQLWSYQPDADLTFATAAIADGRVLASYAGAWTGSYTQGRAAVGPDAVAIDGATGAVDWTVAPDPAQVTSIQAWRGVYASPDVPGADGHAVAFAWRAATRDTIVELRDARTGALLQSVTNGGYLTHEQFLSDPAVGLVQLHNVSMQTIHPDGTANDTNVFPSITNGTFATAPGGKRVLVTAAGLFEDGGIDEWSLATLDTPMYSYPDPVASADDYYSGNVLAADLTGEGSDLAIGFQSDLTALTLAWQASGQDVSGDFSDPEPHGIAPYRLQDPGTGASSSTAKPAAAAPDPNAAPSAPTPQPVTVPGLDHFAKIAYDHVVAPAPKYQPKALGAAPAIRGYTPARIHGVLGLSGDGSGQTVAIVDAYGSPTITNDVNVFSAQFNLPQTCGSSGADADCFGLEVVYPQGQPDVNGGWAEETSLDVEWVHAVAPKAKIVLVATASAGAQDLYGGIDAAAALHPAAISNSWGSAEFSEESFYFDHCKLKSSVCLFSAGDDGYPTSSEAANPYGVAVGGTKLTLAADGSVSDETAWTSSGGGASYFTPEPGYQKRVQRTGYRGTPDVSFDANPTTGVAVYLSATGRPLWLQVGGTSLSAPIWAAVLAVSDQLRAAGGVSPLGGAKFAVHKALYALSGDAALHDVTAGSNGACGAQCTAGPGYDFVTGIGSPRTGVDAALAGTDTRTG